MACTLKNILKVTAAAAIIKTKKLGNAQNEYIPKFMCLYKLFGNNHACYRNNSIKFKVIMKSILSHKTKSKYL